MFMFIISFCFNLFHCYYDIEKKKKKKKKKKKYKKKT